MESADLLQTIAEVAAAFAGFAAIVVAVRSRGERGLAPEDSLRLQIMLGSSLATIGFSFVPQWLWHVGVSDSTCWAVSSAGIAAYLAIVVPLDVRRGRELVASGQLRKAGARSAATIAVLAFLSQLANATGLVWGRTFGGFLGGLLLLLLLSGFAFFRLVALSSRA